MNPAHGVHVLEIQFELDGTPRTIYPTLISDNNSLVLVDTGFQGQLPLFRTAIEDAGYDIEKITTIIITHHDRDHIGGLPEFVKLLGSKVTLLSHAAEKAYIEGTLHFTKKAPSGQTDTPSQERHQTTGVQITRTLSDNEHLPFCEGITVIHTPGHTPGHLCLYLEKSKILITGDALNVINQTLDGPNPVYSHNTSEAFRSLVKLLRLDIQSVISYHGGYFESAINQHLIDLIQKNVL